MTAEEKLKMLMSTGEFDFIKEIPKDALWKLLFMAAFMSDTARLAQPERKKGKWILVKGSNGKDYHKCSECLHTQDITGVKNYCPVCGADMMGEENG